jgi:hypothetical protein
MDAGDKESAAAEFTAIGSMAPGSPVVADLISLGQSVWLCSLALLADASGEPAEADSLSRSGRFVDCHRYRGDILEVWGDVLVKQGHPQEALAKYDEALMYAPNWNQLKEARDAVAKQRS